MVVFRQIDSRLKGDKTKNTGLRLEHKAVNMTPLGYSHGANSRQSSAVYFRPVGYKTKAGDDQYSLLIYVSAFCSLPPLQGAVAGLGFFIAWCQWEVARHDATGRATRFTVLMHRFYERLKGCPHATRWLR